MRDKFLSLLDTKLNGIYRGSRLRMLKTIRRHVPNSYQSFGKKYPALGYIKDKTISVINLTFMKAFMIFIALPIVISIAVVSVIGIAFDGIKSCTRRLRFWK